MMLEFHIWLFPQSFSDNVDLSVASAELSAPLMREAPSATNTIWWSRDSDKCPWPLVTCTHYEDKKKKGGPTVWVPRGTL